MNFRSRSTRFSLFTTLFSLFAILYFVLEYRSSLLPSALHTNLLLIYSLIDLFLAELLILLVAGLFLANGKVLARSILYLISSIFITVYYLQMASIHVGREFLSRLALDNIDHLYIFLDLSYLVFFIAIGATCALLIFFTEKGTPSSSRSFQMTTAVLLIFSALVAVSSSYWLPASVIEARNNKLARFNLAHTSPVASLFATLFLQDLNYPEPLLHRELKAYELKEIGKFGFHYDPTADYPLIKKSIYASAPPFPSRPGEDRKIPNVIVFFSEGISARSIGSYGSPFSDLTPNIDKMAEESMIVSRYYNHTAATYRGLHGQLASIFPYYGGRGGWHSDNPEASGRSYLSLADLFDQAGYETIFLDSHHQDHPSQVDRMMNELGFTTVISGDRLAEEFLGGNSPIGDMAYSDHQYISGVIGFLKQRSAQRHSQPFFLSLYNFGTHAFMTSPKDGVSYKNNRNSALRSIHNFDHAFGRLWSYFRNSPYSKNTIFIFTADHCRYHERSFVKAFESPDYQQLFVDRIPLIIYDPSRLLPPTYDAENSSSLDFAPTIAHYLGLENRANPFMGKSIFERDRKAYRDLSVAALGPGEIFLISDKQIHSSNNSRQYRFTLEVLTDFVELVRQLEVDDLIWTDNQDQVH